MIYHQMVNGLVLPLMVFTIFNSMIFEIFMLFGFPTISVIATIY